MSILLSLRNAISRKPSQFFALWQGKYNSIKFSAQTKLGRTRDAISRAIQDETISSAEFHKILQDMGKHCKLKKKRFKEIQSKSKTDYKKTPRTIP